MRSIACIVKIVFVVCCILLFAIPGMAHDKVVIVPLSGSGNKAKGDAVADEVLEGKTFSNSDETEITGSMPDNGAVTITPSNQAQAIPAGYHDGSGTVATDANLTPANIKDGVTIFGLTGNFTEETSNSMSEGDLLIGKVGYVNGTKVTGSMTSVGAQNIMPGTDAQGISQGYHDGSGTVNGDEGLISDNIKAGISIFGISGKTEVVDTSSGDAQDIHIFKNKKAWVDGVERTGTQGMFWGCHPGREWGEVACQQECIYQQTVLYGEELISCGNFCFDLWVLVEVFADFDICQGSGISHF